LAELLSRLLMTSRFKFSLATTQDDAQLRARMASDWMDGNIAISFRREPSYFAGCCLQGDTSQIIKCVDVDTGQIAGLGSRNTFTAYIDGHPTRIGYLADLRAASAYRGGTLLARGFRLLNELHVRDPVPFYTTVIYEGNKSAVAALLGGRAGLPTYRDCGRILTPAIHLDLPRRSITIPGITALRADRSHLPAIVEFLNTWQCHKQFAPCYRETDFSQGRLLDLRAEDFFLLHVRGKIVATLAAWDQSRVRQTHVERYASPLSWLRPFYNVAARLSPLKRLPNPGAAIPYLYLACIVAESNDVALARCLVRFAYNSLRRGPWHYAVASLHESDPLAAVLDEYRRIHAAGRLYVVYYANSSDRVVSLKPSIPYIEGGCL
jgi:hypothetical protein